MVDEGGAASSGRDASSDATGGHEPADAGAKLPAHTFVYVGSYADRQAFRVYEIARDTLALREVTRDVDAGSDPSYICGSRDGQFLYVANESSSSPGVTVLKVDPKTGMPTWIDHESALSAGIVFTALDPSGKYLLAASYDGGNVAVYPVHADGTLDPFVDTESFGTGAQSHSVRVHASGKWAFVPNKGLDSVAQFLFDDQTGQLTPNGPGPLRTYRGPRHIAFSPDGRFAFLIHELANELSSLEVQPDGTLREIDHEPRLPPNAPDGSDTGAHVLAHPYRSYVYGSNRGTDTLVVFSYDDQGMLTRLEHQPTGGATPRNFDIDPYGQFLIVANQAGDDGGSLAVFAIGADGRLTARGNTISVPSANSVLIVGF